MLRIGLPFGNCTVQRPESVGDGEDVVGRGSHGRLPVERPELSSDSQDEGRRMYALIRSIRVGQIVQEAERGPHGLLQLLGRWEIRKASPHVCLEARPQST